MIRESSRAEDGASNMEEEKRLRPERWRGPASIKKVDTTRRGFLMLGGKILVMTAAASAALEHVLAGTPEKAETYATADHWWVMVIDIEKCIGCGNCAKACKAENDVVDEPYYFRTGVERAH